MHAEQCCAYFKKGIIYSGFEIAAKLVKRSLGKVSQSSFPVWSFLPLLLPDVEFALCKSALMHSLPAKESKVTNLSVISFY